jgi:hypothetical protein
MVEDLGRAALDRLRELLDVETVHEDLNKGWRWTLHGAVQRAWSLPAPVDRGYPMWRIHLRTRAIEGFSGTPGQNEALSIRVALPTVASLAQSSDAPACLDLASSLEVHRGNVSWVPEILALVARIQVVEAHRLSQSRGFGWLGLRPAVESDIADPSLLTGWTSTSQTPAWPDAEIADCVDVLVRRARAEVIPMPTRMSTSLMLDPSSGPPCILQIKTTATHALLGEGLQAVLNVASASSPLRAIVVNALELGAQGVGDSLGGWWATSGGVLRYCGFYPNALYRKGLALQLLLGYAERAHRTSLRWFKG